MVVGQGWYAERRERIFMDECASDSKSTEPVPASDLKAVNGIKVNERLSFEVKCLLSHQHLEFRPNFINTSPIMVKRSSFGTDEGRF
jgi:hypothetical protein